MKEQYVNAFLSPALLVWEKELEAELKMTGAESVTNQFTSSDLTVIIGISGQLEGNALYGFGMETARSVASKMIGREVKDLDEMALSAIGEIANMITGNAATLLSSLGMVCNISPPVIIEPMGSRFTTRGMPQILAKFASDLGPLHIRISLTERHVIA